VTASERQGCVNVGQPKSVFNSISLMKGVRCVQLTPEVKQFFETAGPEVGAAVAARVAQMADAVFPLQRDQDSVPLAVLNGALVSPRGAEVCSAA
jgi:hypothetical protein